MNTSSETLYVEIRIPYCKTEQEFLRLAVQAASKKYRQLDMSALERGRAEVYVLSEDMR